MQPKTKKIIINLKKKNQKKPIKKKRKLKKVKKKLK